MAKNFWDGPRTTYVNGSLPAINADDLNGVQQDGDDAGGIFVHSALWIYDDFFSANGQMGGSYSDWAYALDHGASGAIEFNKSTNAAEPVILPGDVFLGTGDLRFEARLRVPSFGGGQSNLLVGVSPVLNSAGNMLALVRNANANGNGNWWLWYGVNATPTQVDTGVTTSTSYQTIEIRRTSGVIEVLIGGAQVALASPSPFALDGSDINGNDMRPMIAASRDSSGTTHVLADYFKMWARTGR